MFRRLEQAALRLARGQGSVVDPAKHMPLAIPCRQTARVDLAAALSHSVWSTRPCRPDLHKSRVNAADQHAAGLALVTVDLAALSHGLTIEQQVRREVLRC